MSFLIKLNILHLKNFYSSFFRWGVLNEGRLQPTWSHSFFLPCLLVPLQCNLAAPPRAGIYFVSTLWIWAYPCDLLWAMGLGRWAFLSCCENPSTTMWTCPGWPLGIKDHMERGPLSSAQPCESEHPGHPALGKQVQRGGATETWQ